LALVLILMTVGLIVIFSASSVLSFVRYGNNYYFILRQLIFTAIGLAIMFILSYIDYHLWKKWAFYFLLAGLAVLAVVLLPKIGFQVGNARRGVNLGWFLIQPSEFVKLLLILYLASWFDRKKDAESNFWFGIIPPLLLTGLSVGLVVLEPDLGTAIMMCLIIFVMLFAAGTKIRYLVALAAMFVAGAWILIAAAPYRAARLVTFFDPSLDPQGIGYHINQALLAIGSGGFWGYGYGGSRQKHNYLPEPIGDSIFAVMAEELGLFRIVAVVGVFWLLAMKGVKVARSAPDKFGQLIAMGVTSWIILQTIINIGAITNFLPLTGIPMPFISYGGSSLLSLCAAVGILLNISKQRV